MPEHKMPYSSPQHVLTIIKNLFDLAGTKLSSIILEKGMVTANLEEEIVIPPTVDVIEHIRNLEQVVSLEDYPVEKDPLLYVLDSFRRLSMEALPRFFIVSPVCIFKDMPLWEYIYHTPMFKYMFGMIVLEDDRLDSSSFLMCGVVGLGTETSTIVKVYKGYVRT